MCFFLKESLLLSTILFFLRRGKARKDKEQLKWTQVVVFSTQDQGLFQKPPFDDAAAATRERGALTSLLFSGIYQNVAKLDKSLLLLPVMCCLAQRKTCVHFW